MSFFKPKKLKGQLGEVARREYLDMIQPKRHMKRTWAVNNLSPLVDSESSESHCLNLILSSCSQLGSKAAPFEARAVGIVKTFELIYPGEISEDLLPVYTKSALLGIYGGIFENSLGNAISGKIHPQIWNALLIYVQQLEERYSSLLLQNHSNDLLDLINYVGYCVGRSPDLHIGRATKDL